MNKLSKQEAQKLLGLVPSLCAWVSTLTPNSGELLATKASTRKNSTQPKEVIRAIFVFSRLKSLLELSNNDLSKVYNDFEPDVLLKVLFLIVSNSKSPLVNGHCYKGLAESLPQMKNYMAENTPISVFTSEEHEDFVEDLWLILHRLPITNFYALAEICQLVKDNGPHIYPMCKVLGPKTLLPEEEGSVDIKRASHNKQQVQEQMASGLTMSSINIDNIRLLASDSEIEQSIDILLFLVTYAEVFFFKYKKQKDFPNSGYRQQLVTIRDVALVQKKERSKELKKFYTLMDPSYAKIAKRLFEYFHFHTIAKAIWEEYQYLPTNWIEKLSLYELENRENKEVMRELEWFSKKRGTLVEVREDLINSATVEKNFYKVKEGGELEKTVEELVVGESKYYQRLKLFKEIFVIELLNLASKPRNEKKIGLTKAEILRIFGERLDDIINASEKLLHELEALRLIRENVIPGANGAVRTRGSLLADIFLSHGPELRDAYTKYTSGQKSCSNILNLATAKAKSMKKERSKEMHFTKLFEEFSKNKQHLRGLGLEPILHSPCLRFVQYKLMFDRIHKYVKKKVEGDVSGEVQKLQQTIGLCDSMSMQLNGGIKTADKLNKIFGEDIG